MRRLGSILIGAGLLALAAVIWYSVHNLNLFHQQKEDNAQVILQQMKAVTKLVTAEGYFSEIYDYKDYYQWDISLTRKKALMRVKAKVLMGYDLEKLDFRIDPESKTIRVSDPASPEILALEHDVDFYDLTSGTFNRFSESDINDLQGRAKNFITQVAMKSDLVDLANERKADIFDLLEQIANSAGYTLIVTTQRNSEPTTTQSLSG